MIMILTQTMARMRIGRGKRKTSKASAFAEHMDIRGWQTLRLH